VVAENIHTHPIDGHWKFRGGGEGSEKIKFLKESMKLNWNFQRSGRGMDIFWNITLGNHNSYM